MPNRSPPRVRFLLLGVLSVLVVGFAHSDGQAQFGRPPGGIGGRPPIGFNGGIGGMPGRPGGSTGISGAGIAGMPGRPGGIAGISGMGLSGGIGGLGSRMEWRCSRCNGQLANGAVMTCPHCGARLVGVTFEHGGISGRPNMPNIPNGPGAMPFSSRPPGNASPTFPASTDNRPGEMPPLTPNPNAGRGESGSDSNASSTSSGSDSSTSSSSSDSSSSGRTWKIIALVVATVFFLVIVAMLIVVVSKSSGGKPAPRRRPMSLDDDDDDD